MRVLVFLESDIYVRNFVSSGLLDRLEERGLELLVAARADVATLHTTNRRPPPIYVPGDPRRDRVYSAFRLTSMAHRRNESRTMAIKVGGRRAPIRWLSCTFGSRWLFPLFSRAVRRLLGRNDSAVRLLADTQPDVVLLPSAGTDSIVSDLTRAAGEAGIPTMLAINGWDNISSKSHLPFEPSILGVWGPHDAALANRIHGIPNSRIREIGTPTFEAYLDYSGEGVEREHLSRRDKPYLLFAGCALPFDELGALHALEAALADLKLADRYEIVYRPHPWRHTRACPDHFIEANFNFTVLDPQMAASYERSVEEGPQQPDDFVPSLDYYPALLSAAETVICPLSTMIVESLLCATPTVALTYDDGIHALSLSRVSEFDHFVPIEAIPGVVMCGAKSDLGPALSDALGSKVERSDIVDALSSTILTTEPGRYSDRLFAALEDLCSA